MTRLQKTMPWLAGILIATLLMGSLALFADIQYTGNDDTPLLRATMGYMGGEPATFTLHTHAALTWLLYALAKLAPGVAWLSIVQLFLLWFSQVVIVKSLCRMAQRRGLPLWAGAGAAALLLGAYAVYISCRITYTVTAALCGAAAVAWLFSVDFSGSRRQVFAGVLGSAAMLLACYFLRMSAVLPAACFWLLIFTVKFLPARPRHALAALLTVVLVFALAAGGMLLNTRAQGAWEDTRWHNARIQLFDYTGFATEIPDATLAELGWSRDELELVENWFFLNDNITLQAFQTLVSQQTAAKPAPGMGERLRAAWQTVRGLFAENKLRLALWCTLLMALAAAMPGAGRTRVTLALALLGGFALLILLGFMGRLNARAAYTILLPASAVIFASLFDGDAPPDRRRMLAALAPLAACLALTVFAVLAQADAAYIAPSPYFTDTTSDLHADLDEIALMNDDKLIIYDLSLSQDHRLFPDTAEGMPQNLMLWGGWTAHTPAWRKMLANFGITALDPSLFLRDNVLFASTYDQPPEALLRYVAQGADGTVDWMYWDQWGYVNLFEFNVY